MPAPRIHGAFGPRPPIRHHAPVQIAPDAFLIRSVVGEGEGPVYWAVDTYGCLIAEPVADVAELDPAFWQEWFVVFNRTNSPWSALADPRRFAQQVERVDRLGASVLASAHGPLITGRHVAAAHDMMRQIAGGEAPPPPTQADLDNMLAALVPEPALA